MSEQYQFGFEHLLKAAQAFVSDEDWQDCLSHAQDLATRQDVKLKNIQVGDHFQLDWYLPKNEAYIVGECLVTKIEDGEPKRIHFEPLSNFGRSSIAGKSDLQWLKERGPIFGKAIERDIVKVWRFVPYRPTLEATP